MTPLTNIRAGFSGPASPIGDLIAAAVAAVLAPVAVLGAASTLVALRAGDANRSHSVTDDLTSLTRRFAIVFLPFAAVSGQPRAWLSAFAAAAVTAAAACAARVRRSRRSGRDLAGTEPTVVVGDAHDVAIYVRQFAVHSELGAWPVATVGDEGEQPTMLPHSSWDRLTDVVAEHHATHVLLATPARTGRVEEQWTALRRANCRLSVVAPLGERLTSGAQVVDVRGVPVLSLDPRPHGQPVHELAKRVVDLTVAAVSLVVLAPVLFAIVAAIRLDDRGPSLFRQIRVGRDGRLFTMYKFRSTVLGAEELRARIGDANEAQGPFVKVVDDPLITRLGRFLRRFSLDELPQLVNVLRGEMSLVGPRPCLPTEAAEAPELMERRDGLRPGMTGLWQVAGRSWLPAAEGARMDAAYVENRSLLLDARILGRTALVALRNDRRPPVDGRDDVIGFDRHRYAGLVVDDDLLPRAAVDVSIVIVTHESQDEIESCLRSVVDNRDAVTREVIVVDNLSFDDTTAIVRTQFPSARLIAKRRRDGFATNSNIGVVASAGRHVLFLNPDARLLPGSLDGLVAHLDHHEEVGVVGPALRFPDGTPQASARQFPTFINGVVRRTPLRALFPSVADGHLMDDAGDHVRDVDWMLGGALATRRSALDHVGGFDDRFRLYCEDMDLCWRMREKGWRVQQQPAVIIEHALDELTTRRFLTRRTLWHLRSALRFVRLHGFGRPEPEIDLAPVQRRLLIEAAARTPIPVAA